MRHSRAPTFLFTGLLAMVLGIWAGNSLVYRLELNRVPNRTYFLTSLKALVTPESEASLALQNSIYQSRVTALENKKAELSAQLDSVNDYLAPLEADLQTYRKLRTERVQLSQEEQTQLYIDLVSRYRDYQRALNSIETFVPLEEGESLLAFPSVYRDLILRQGGEVAHEHNRFLNEPRDPAFAAQYEAPLRRFLADYDLNTVIIECRQHRCELHLSGLWDDAYYRAFDAIYEDLQQKEWFNLARTASAHQYRGGGVQIQVWLLEASP